MHFDGETCAKPGERLTCSHPDRDNLDERAQTWSAIFPGMGQESGRRPKFEADSRDSRAPGSEEDHRAFNSTVGDAIRRGRQAFGWTQAQLANASGLSPNYVARLERGELGPSLFVASRICEALKIDLEVLLGTGGGGGAKRTTTRSKRAG